jgi:hypothetical protein
MESRSLTIGAEDLARRIRERLVGLASTASQVVWQSGAHAVVIHGERLQARMLRGWLIVALELETAQTGRRPLELVFYLGAPREGDGTTAAVRINAASPEATQLAEIWGDDLQRVVWDAVLDAIQLALQTARREKVEGLTLRGFQATPAGLRVDVVTGAL